MERTRVGGMILACAVCMHAQTLSPREIFYGEGRAAAPPKTVSAAKPKVAAHKPAPAVIPEAARPVEQEVAATQAPHSTRTNVSTPTPVSTPSPVSTEAPQRSSEEAVVSLVSSKTSPLGLKYSVLKRGTNGEYSEVDPDSNFSAGDHIKVSVEVNDSGYLYVVAQGTSGIWQVLYPSKDVNGGDNRVREGRQYSIPNDAVFTFDSRAGKEKLFVVLSRQPEQDLESLIYSLREKPSESARPMLAGNSAPIQNDLVQRMRQTYSRDLVIEKVDDAKTPPSEEIKKIEVKHGAMVPAGEKAVYVVNQNAGANARVVADVELRHQ